MSLQLHQVAIRRTADGPQGAPLFAPLTLTVEAGQIAAIMGPSGAGKSTLFAAIGGHLAGDFYCGGQILLNGQSLLDRPAHLRRVGLMFQDAVLFPHLSVAENLAFGLTDQIKGRSARRDRVELALRQAGLSGMGRRDPATLSGGERARIALMRTLLAAPMAVLLDEPFSKLDQHLRSDMRAFTYDLIRAQSIPALIVTHDLADAQTSLGPIVHLTR